MASRDPLQESESSRIEALQVEESTARGKRFSLDEFAISLGREWMDSNAKSLSVAVSRIKHNNPKRDYNVERMMGIADSGEHLLCSVLVTRVK